MQRSSMIIRQLTPNLKNSKHLRRWDRQDPVVRARLVGIRSRAWVESRFRRSVWLGRLRSGSLHGDGAQNLAAGARLGRHAGKTALGA